MKNTIKKYLEGNAKADELKSLLHWVEKDSNITDFKNQREEWKANPDRQNLSSDTLLELDKFKSTMLLDSSDEIRKINTWQNIYKYAALIFLVLAIGSLLVNFGKSVSNHLFYNTIYADNGQISKALLPDGTTVWLNSGSSIKYNNQFGIEHRNVVLIGEAYFDVTTNENLPMNVSCDEIDVRVFGTQFTVENYADQDDINIVLVEGSVNLYAKNSKKPFVKMAPNDKVEYNKSRNIFKQDQVVASKYVSWREGVIHIYDQKLKDVVVKLEKRYNQRIILAPELKDYQVTFSIRNEDFGDVMAILQAISPARASQKGDLIYLKKKE